MEETYTFSRALHLMRYGGKKMQFRFWDKSHYLEVKGEILWETLNNGKDWFGAKIDGFELMGSWVEVKE